MYTGSTQTFAGAGSLTVVLLAAGTVAVSADCGVAPPPPFDADDFLDDFPFADWGTLDVCSPWVGEVVVTCSEGLTAFAEAVLEAALFDGAAELEPAELELVAEELEGAEPDMPASDDWADALAAASTPRAACVSAASDWGTVLAEYP